MESIVDVLFYAMEGHLGIIKDVAVWAPFPLDLCIAHQYPKGEVDFICETSVGGVYEFTLSGGFTL
jgi:hypothetical protein